MVRRSVDSREAYFKDEQINCVHILWSSEQRQRQWSIINSADIFCLAQMNLLDTFSKSGGVLPGASLSSPFPCTLSRTSPHTQTNACTQTTKNRHKHTHARHTNTHTQTTHTYAHSALLLCQKRLINSKRLVCSENSHLFWRTLISTYNIYQLCWPLSSSHFTV